MAPRPPFTFSNSSIVRARALISFFTRGLNRVAKLFTICHWPTPFSYS